METFRGNPIKSVTWIILYRVEVYIKSAFVTPIFIYLCIRTEFAISLELAILYCRYYTNIPGKMYFSLLCDILSFYTAVTPI